MCCTNVPSFDGKLQVICKLEMAAGDPLVYELCLGLGPFNPEDSCPQDSSDSLVFFLFVAFVLSQLL